MIFNKNVASVYFDSLQMTLTVVSDKGGYGCVDFSAKNTYTGVSKNFFVAPNEIEGLLVDLLNRYNSFSGKRINRLKLILPQHFFRLQASVCSRDIDKNVTDKDINALRKNSPDVPDGYYLIDRVEGGFSVDGQGDFTSDVVGKEGSTCQMLTAETYLSYNVYELFGNISKNIRIDFDFIAPSNTIVSKLKQEKQKRGLVLHINQLTSDLIYFEDRLPVSALDLSFGSFHFASVLTEKFGIDFDIASKLLDHVNLGLANDDDSYVVFSGEKKRSFSVKETNTALTKAIEYWANETKSAVKGLVEEEIIPLYLTGSSIVFMQGLCELLSLKTGLNVYSLCPDYSCWIKPEDYVLCALFEKY